MQFPLHTLTHLSIHFLKELVCRIDALLVNAHLGPVLDVWGQRTAETAIRVRIGLFSPTPTSTEGEFDGEDHDDEDEDNDGHVLDQVQLGVAPSWGGGVGNVKPTALHLGKKTRTTAYT